MCITEYELALKKKEVLVFVTTWMNLYTILRQNKANTERQVFLCYHIYVELKKVKFTETGEWLLPGAKGVGHTETSQGVWTFHCKMCKVLEYNV